MEARHSRLQTFNIETMDLAINITSSCRVRVLLVPVPPIKSSTFWKHVELVKKFSVVRLGDVTPDLQKGAGAMFSSQVFQEGQMHFQFTTTYTRDHAYLEDFQPHRRIFGVIGIMDCQAWKDKSLGEGYRHFVDTLHKYPTAIATRCFAFDPTETQPDDTKGLIMIPNVGNMSFYMSTMICDFASEILSQFSLLAARIENLQSLESPMPRAYYISQAQEMPGPVPQPSASTPGPSTFSSAPSRGPYNNHRASQPPRPVQSSSSSLLKRASTPTGTNRTGSFSQKYAPSMSRSAMSPPLPSPQPTMTRSSSAQGISPGGENGKTKRRTPGRIKKLLADLYLLAGRLPDAVNHYTQAIELAKATSDFLWWGSALEGLTCATLLLEYLHADVGHIVSRSRSAPGEGTTETPSSPTTEMPSSSLLTGPRSTISEVMERYNTLLQHYSKVSTTSAIPMPSLIYAEACVKVARFLQTVYANNGWSDRVLSLLVQGKVVPDDKPKDTGGGFISIATLTERKSSGIARSDISNWVTRIWNMPLDDLSLLDQINLITQMSSVLDFIGYHRKSAWLMYESVNRMLPLLIQSRATLASSRDQAKKDYGKNDSGILTVLKRVCEVYGLGERNVHDGGALEAMHGQEDGEKEDAKGQGVRGAAAKEQLRFGWPELQIDILRQCISIAEALPDYGAVLYYTTVLLKNLYQYISKEEQIRLASSIQRIVAMGKRVGHVENNVNYWGVNIVSSVEAVMPIARKAVYKHSLQSRNNQISMSTAGSGDPFIYNPFTQKRNEKQQIILVNDEVSEFKVTLSNPFGFDLELQNVVLSTSGIPFNAIPATATIPANGTLNMRLTGTPEKAGTLTVRGCIIKIAGFAEQEFLVDYGQKMKALEDSKNKNFKEEKGKTDFIKLKHSGLGAIQSSRKRETSNEMKPIEFYELQVIDDQPLLKIKSTSLLHDAVMLYDGEMTHVTIELENIGNVPVDSMTLSFVDSTTLHPLPINPELPMEEQYEIELYTKGMHVFSWEGCKDQNAHVVGKQVSLAPGEHLQVQVNVYGKRGCTGGTIQIDYGYLNREEKQEELTEFFTRQLYLPVLITVYQNLEPLNWDILYLRHNSPVAKHAVEAATHRLEQLNVEHDESVEQPVEDLLLITRQDNSSQDKNDYCLVTLDVRNTWTVPFAVDFVVDNSDSKTESKLHSTVTIYPGSTKRMVLPVKRIFLAPSECLQPIPSLEPNKQFVVSQAPKMPPEQERARLQMFWYRENLLRRIKATWRCCSTGRQGTLNLRPSLRLTPMQLSILKKEDIEFIVDLQGNGVKKLAHRNFQCNANEFVTMHITLLNRQAHPVKLILRVQPVQSYNDAAKEYDLSGKLLMQGLQQVVLPEIPPNGGIATHRLPACFLSRGRFEFLYHAEDVHSRSMHYDHEWTIVDVEGNA